MTTPALPSIALRRALVGLGVVAVLSVGALALTAGPTIEILADGTVHDVPAAPGSVADALDAAGVDLGDDDLVSPDLNAEAEPGTRIVVTRAITVEVVVEDETTTVTAPVRSVDGAVRAAGFDQLRIDGAVATPGWHDPVTDGDVITIETPVEVTLDVDGQQRRVDV
ncbi:MAG: ubiquitin-like domain-containing protein, partial [Nitriliruptoraceae bacterium]